jgi:predicted transcriptional regulator
MSKSLLEMAAEIVSGQSSQRTLTGAEIENLLRDTFRALKELEKLESSGAIPESISIGEHPLASDLNQSEIAGTTVGPKIDPSESIREDAITCLECGQEFRQLTHTHLRREHGLTPNEYKLKYHIPSKQPLTALSVSRRRRDQAKEQNVGEQLRQARAAARTDQPRSNDRTQD